MTTIWFQFRQSKLTELKPDVDFSNIKRVDSIFYIFCCIPPKIFAMQLKCKEMCVHVHFKTLFCGLLNIQWRDDKISGWGGGSFQIETPKAYTYLHCGRQKTQYPYRWVSLGMHKVCKQNQRKPTWMLVEYKDSTQNRDLSGKTTSFEFGSHTHPIHITLSHTLR